jgi:hypothetical protein
MELYVAERDRILQDPTASPMLKSAILALGRLDAASAVHTASTLFALAELRHNEGNESPHSRKRTAAGR